MARVTYVKRAQARFKTVPDVDPVTGEQKTITVLGRDGQPKRTRRGDVIVRRLTVEDKSQPLPNLKCEKCSTEIKPGDPYKWVKPKSGPYGGRKRTRCAACPNWRSSELTSSPALSTLYAAQETFADDLAAAETAEDVKAALEALAEGVREAGEVYRESASNIEDGFGHSTYQSEELNEKADALESAADEIENADVEDFDEDAARSDVEAEILSEYLDEIGLPTDLTLEAAEALEEYPEGADEFDAEEYERRVEDAVEEKRQEHLDDVKEAAEDAASAADAL